MIGVHPPRVLPPYSIVVSVGGYLATVSGRTTCAPCKADGPSMASVFDIVCTLVVGYSAAVRACQRVDKRVARLWTTTVWLGKIKV